MHIINIDTWSRKQQYEHFSKMQDPFFGVTMPFNVSKAYEFSKDNDISFFAKYLHDCMKAINAVDNLKLRIEENEVVFYEVIHASSTLMRADGNFGLSFIPFSEDLNGFIININKEKERVFNSTDFFPPNNSLDCIHCSALPWVNFLGHKEPVSGMPESVPKVAFSKTSRINSDLIMNVSINVNHALVDGYHVGLFSEKFQIYLNQ